MLLKEMCAYLDDLLETSSFRDDSANGLQVENSENVDKVGLAVDACQEAITKASKLKCNLLIVHHGLFWGKESVLVDVLFQRVRSLIMADIALYATHLPLDAHPVIGHNAQIAEILGLTDREPFAPLHGKPIGIKGRLPGEITCEEAEQKCRAAIGACTGFLAFGPPHIRTVGIIAGSATDPALFKELKVLGIDLFITGEPKHGAFHLAQEYGINIFYGSHYITETFGLRALARLIDEQCSLPAVFIDAPCLL